MKKKPFTVRPGLVCILLISIVSCKEKSSVPSKELISEINLRRGDIIYCGPADKQFGTVDFLVTGSEKIKADFNLAVEMLHSFEYEEAEKVFAKIIDEEPQCAMAYWGVAMCNYHALWTPPTEAELKKGAKASEIANSITQKSAKEAAYIDAISSFYKDWDKTDHHTRTLAFEKGMEKLYESYPGDKEVAVFYALALDAAADPADKSFANQKKAGTILTALYVNEPNHPGIAHYIIHTYDYPELASLALPVARRYASIAPSSAHALHMPSHIFTRLGLWDECIRSNLVSVESAKCYAAAAGMRGHWDEELHGMDYLVYAYLQKGENKLAKEQWNYLLTMDNLNAINFKEAYAFAAIPSRYLLENKIWDQAATVKISPADFPWKKFGWQEAIIHFTRVLGNVHIGKIDSAKTELMKLQVIHDTLVAQKDAYKANQVMIQIKAADGWIQWKEGKNVQALSLMTEAAEMEDKTEKHPVTPGEVLPARELLGDLLLQMNKPAEALPQYEADLVKHPNRFNGLYGAGLAAEKIGDKGKAKGYYQQLLNNASKADADRTELPAVKLFLKNN
jgi:tetratricopeptide (TPR) repeat protein